MTTVVKVGGSLAADPVRRRALLAEIAEGLYGPCVVVPGGGAFADAVRTAQVRDGFDEGEAHRRALDAMGRMADAFRVIEPRLVRAVTPWTDAHRSPRSRPLLARGSPSPAEGGGRSVSFVWDPVALRAGHPDIPETWDVTSDSLALWLAARLRAPRCVLVKSADAPADRDAADLARLGLVDAAFPGFAVRYVGTIEIWGPSGTVFLERRAAA